MWEVSKDGIVTLIKNKQIGLMKAIEKWAVVSEKHWQNYKGSQVPCWIDWTRNEESHNKYNLPETLILSIFLIRIILKDIFRIREKMGNKY